MVGRKNFFRFEIWVHKNVDNYPEVYEQMKKKLGEIFETSCNDTRIKI
jgi:hypothetical protein